MATKTIKTIGTLDVSIEVVGENGEKIEALPKVTLRPLSRRQMSEIEAQFTARVESRLEGSGEDPEAGAAGMMSAMLDAESWMKETLLQTMVVGHEADMFADWPNPAYNALCEVAMDLNHGRVTKEASKN